jgi:hypothetical protein
VDAADDSSLVDTEPPNQLAAPYWVEVAMLAALPVVFACFGVTGATKAMLVLAGVIGGCYAGAHLGEAMEENGGFPGMTIGAALGGWIAWTLVK